MTQVHPEIDQLYNEGRYARFLKVDLHVHTPATPWCWNQHRQADAAAAGALKPRDVAEAIVASTVDVVAVTDHDAVSWVGDVVRETKQLAKRKGRQVTVLPGVEITTYDGVHLLAIFSTATPVTDIHNMLIRFGLNATGAKSERASSDWPVDKIAAEVNSLGGLVIAPHATNPKMGIWGGEKSVHQGKRMKWMEDGVARILACAPEQRGSLAAAIKNAGISRRFAFIRHSDAHTFAAIGQQATYIKLAESSIEGLRQVIHEPELRVSFTPPPATVHPRIIGMEITGGYFSKERLVFSEHLNTLIGGNYSGKSAVVDALRFVFDDQCFGDAAERHRLFDRVDGIVNGGHVRVWFLGADGSYYRAERQVVVEWQGHGENERATCDVQAVVTKLDGGIELPIDSLPQDVLPIDFYGQGSVGQVAQYAGKHRELIDTMAGATAQARSLDPVEASNRGLVNSLAVNALDIERTQDECGKLCLALEALPQLREQLQKLESQSKSKLLKGWGRWQDAQQTASAVREYLDDRTTPTADSIVANVLDEQPEVDEFSEEAEHAIRPLRKALDKLASRSTEASEVLATVIAAEIKACTAALGLWDKAYEKQREQVNAKLRELRLGSEEGLLKRIGELKTQIAQIEKKKAPELEKVRARLDGYEKKRKGLMSELSSAWRALQGLRRQTVDYLNDATSDEIHIRYEEGTDRARLAARLDVLILEHGSKGAMVQRRDRQIELLITNHDARSLVDILRKGAPEELVDSCGVTSNTAHFLRDLPLHDILSLEPCIADDFVEITYKRPPETEYTGLRDLSPGESAVVLLTVAFANRERPLVIDQPEDELGQALVTADLVDTIRRRKQERQFIIVTHNANIPVLGDAEGIFCMRNDYDVASKTRRCTVEHAGAIECDPIKAALLGLEGGRESFVQRQARYHID